MKKIFCPTDFSETAENAIAYAAKLAQATGAELILLNVQSLFEKTPKEVVFGGFDTLEKASFQLEMLSCEIAKTFKISCYSDVQPAISTLSDILSESTEQADLVVMGTNGADDLYQFFMGSNTYNLVQKISVPLLLIPQGCSYTGIDRIVYAFDYLHERKLPVEQLTPWAEKLNSQLSVLQVLEEGFNAETKLNMETWQVLLKALNADKTPVNFVSIQADDVARSIHSYVLANNVDMLALCTHHYNFIQKLFHKSVIKTISGIAAYPVFIFHN